MSISLDNLVLDLALDHGAEGFLNGGVFTPEGVEYLAGIDRVAVLYFDETPLDFPMHFEDLLEFHQGDLTSHSIPVTLEQLERYEDSEVYLT